MQPRTPTLPTIPTKPAIPYIIIVDDDADLIKQISIYAYENFLKQGRGMVVAKKKQVCKRDASKGKIRVELEYRAKVHEGNDFPRGTKAMVAEYDATREVVLDMGEANGKGKCMMFLMMNEQALPEAAGKGKWAGK